MASLVSTDEVIARVPSAAGMDTDALQLIIDANEQLMGPYLPGITSPIRVNGYPSTTILLPERAGSITSVTEHWIFQDPGDDITLDTDDWRLYPQGTAIERREDGTHPQQGFADEIIIEYVPFDQTALAKNVLIQLCAVDINLTANTGITRQRLGDYEEEHGGAQGSSGAGGIADIKAAIMSQLADPLPLFA
jgi:hypothetical protein